MVSSDKPRIPAYKIRKDHNTKRPNQLTAKVLGVFVVDKGSEVTAVVEDHVEWLVTLEGTKGLLDAPVVFLLGLTLPRVNRHASSGDAGEVLECMTPVLQQTTLTQPQRDPEWRRYSIERV